MINNARFNKAVTIAGSDTVDFVSQGKGTSFDAILCDAIYVGGAGVVPVVMADGTVQNFTAPAGTTLPVRARRVNATNLTATLLVALYSI